MILIRKVVIEWMRKKKKFYVVLITSLHFLMSIKKTSHSSLGRYAEDISIGKGDRKSLESDFLLLSFDSSWRNQN